MGGLAVENVTKEFESAGERLNILAGASLQLAAGENAVVLGPSGSGKSTLLHIIGTLDAPTSGRVLVNDQDIAELRGKALAEFRNRTIGFVFQDHHLLPQLTALENVLLPVLAGGAASEQDVQRARALLDRVGLAERSDHRPAQLSGGERQRASIARALVCGPSVLLADEPTGNLDAATAAAVSELLVDVPREQNAIVVAVTHSTELAARFDRQFTLQGGRLAASAA